ncbi:DUF1294 domain-containing protein [Acidovorax sp. LjRoot129]|uniref:DUF1294 domain-containing protein n=1 Tax=Acidovorax sp. LjRoot129 TaxID=3342260 RepID=UPI003ECFF00F
MSSKQGTVIRWDATRAFGFIRSPGTSADVFFHVRDFRGSAPPREGLAVTFEEIHVGGKGPRAMAVQPTGAVAAGATAGRAAPSRPAARPAAGHSPRQQSPRRAAAADHRRARNTSGGSASAGLALLLTAGWIGLLAWGIWTRQLPLGWTLSAAVAVNLVTFWTYAADKNAATQRRWRTPESSLHLLSLLGGWPGAWLAQQTLRHKSSKREFRAVYWLTVVVHCTALAAWVLGVGR